MDKITEGAITDALNAHYVGNSRYRLANAYIFKSDWESDFFVQKQNGYSYEFEAKISRGDFFNDKKKVAKHLILSTGKFMEQSVIWNEHATCRQENWITTETEKEHLIRPNKFYYVVPDGMIKIEELPKYAGLLVYKNHSINSVKEAPFIHKEKLDFSSILCPKFYNYWIDERVKARQAKNEIDYYKSENERLNQQIIKLKNEAE